MAYLKRVVLAVLFLISANSFSEGYYHIGSGINYVQHNKSLEDYAVVDLKVGIGYEINERLSLELDFALSSDGINEGDATCNTQLNPNVSCTRAEQIDRDMLVISALFHNKIFDNPVFIKPGIGIAKSSYEILHTDDNNVVEKVIDEESRSAIILFNAGYVYKDKHRFSGVISSLYGKSDTGRFSYVGIEYNYLLDTRWNF